MTAKFKLLLVVGVVLLSLTMPSALRADVCGSVAGNLVANCGFETGDFTGWTIIPAAAGSDLHIFGSPVNSGNWSAGFGAVSGLNDYIYQDLTTTPGGIYDVTFYLATGSVSSTGQFVANWGGSNIFTQTGGTNSGSVFTEYSFDEAATASSTQLEFGGNTPPSWYYLDDVSVVYTGTTVTPEPSIILLLGTGLMGLGGLLKRRILG
jgi:hypothetical protein